MKTTNSENKIIEITDSAVNKIQGLIESRGRGQLAVRVIIRGKMPGGGYQSEFKFVGEDDLTDSDVVQKTGSFDLYFDEGCAVSLLGANVDFDEDKYSGGFNIAYPSVDSDIDGPAKKNWKDRLSLSVQKVIDEEINPGIAAHGGWVELLEIQGDTAYIEMGGGCQGCGLSDVTLVNGIERLIIERVSEVEKVIDSTNHAGGTNPYYSPAKGGEDETLESPYS